MIIFFLAEGFEELEAIAPIDILRRGGLDVKLVGVGSKTVTSSHNVTFVCDMTTDEVDFSKLSGVIIPGGMPGTKNLAASKVVTDTLSRAAEKGLIVGAICAAPSVLGGLGLLSGKKATCFPGFEEALTGAEVINASVVRDGNIITSKGAGVADLFGFELLSAFSGKDTADKVRAAMQSDRGDNF